jgi:hypothetical protein
LNAVFLGLKMWWDTFACAIANCLTHFITSIAVLENVPSNAGLQKRATFSTRNVGLAGLGIKPGPPAWQAVALTAQPSTMPRVEVGREREREVEIKKREEIEGRGGEKGRKRDREGGKKKERIVWECWMSSLGMLGRRES